MKRTDTQKLNREPVIVVLGGKQYAIHPQPYGHSRAWKAKARATVESFETLFHVNYEDHAAAMSALKTFIFDTFDEMVDLVFEWDTTLPKDEILDIATEDELLDAVLAVMVLAFPLAQRLGVNLQSLQTMKHSTNKA